MQSFDVACIDCNRSTNFHHLDGLIVDEMEEGRQDEMRPWLLLLMDRTALAMLPEAAIDQLSLSFLSVTTPAPINTLLSTNSAKSVHRIGARLDRIVLRTVASR